MMNFTALFGKKTAAVTLCALAKVVFIVGYPIID